MDTLTVGLNFFGGHDTSIFAIFEDDLYGVSQERITRIKHDSIFPIDALHELLRYKDIDPKKITRLNVGVATKAFEKRIFNEYSYEMTCKLREMIQGDKEHLFIKEFVKEKKKLQNSGKLHMLKSFIFNRYGREYLKMQLRGKKVSLDSIIKKHLKSIFPNAELNIKFYEHHLAHAYSTYYSSQFDKALVFTFDGEGDGSFSKLYSVKDGEFKEVGDSKNIFVENMQKYDFADSGYASVGNIYSIFTHLLGFTPNADEGKVEALAAFGNHDNELYHALCSAVRVNKERLSIMMDEKALNSIFEQSNLDKIFSTLSKEDISAAVQKSTEKIALEYLKVAKERYPTDALCLAGGVTANVIMNMNIFEKLFENLYIIPAMGDDGIAQGVAIMMGIENDKSLKDSFRFPTMPYFGSSYSKDEVKRALDDANLSYIDLGDEAYIKAAEYIVDGKIGALFHGRAEFGPRALGNRSIIADVRNRDIQKIINKDIKNRPLFQPFCPSMIIDERERLFEKSYNNKHMTIAFKLKEEFKEEIPGSVHVDLTARVQFVSPEDNPNYYNMIKKVKELTGFGVIINTSFNKHGRTMVLTPKDAIVDFKDTNLDFMVIEGFLVEK
jgi:carbamoyltransferase